MARRTVTVDGNAVIINDDDALAPERAWWAVVRARAVDEITAAPPLAAMRVTTTHPYCNGRVSRDGYLGLVARPVDVASALVRPGALDATLEADGYLPRSLNAAIDAARRALQPVGANAGDTEIRVAPPDPAPRAQFMGGRGVMLERALATDDEEFVLVRDAAAPPADQVPLAAPLRGAHPVGARVAGVPIVLAEQTLHRAATARVRAQVLRQPAANAAAIAAPAADVGIVGAWWNIPEVRANSAPPHAVSFVSLQAPLAFDHAAGEAVERCTLIPDATLRSLSAVAPRGAREIWVANWTGLAAAGGEVLRLENGNSTERELVVVEGFVPPGNAVTPARLRLRSPVNFPHAESAGVTRMTVVAVPAGTVEREAQTGDAVLFTTDLTAVATMAVLRIAAASQREELRFIRRFPGFAAGAYSHGVPIAADGTFELPALGRLAQIRVRVAHAGQTDEQLDVALDYGGDQTLQIMLKP